MINKNIIKKRKILRIRLIMYKSFKKFMTRIGTPIAKEGGIL